MRVEIIIAAVVAAIVVEVVAGSEAVVVAPIPYHPLLIHILLPDEVLQLVNIVSIGNGIVSNVGQQNAVRLLIASCRDASEVLLREVAHRHSLDFELAITTNTHTN